MGQRSARALFKAICDGAWATGDPGLLFLDTIACDNPTPALGQIESTNPCGEVPLLPYESCNLGSINLARLVIERDRKTAIDWERLQTLVIHGVRFLDDVIAVNRFLLEQIERMTLGNRKIGLGVMGFVCILLGISYNSVEAVQVEGELMGFIAREARAASARLAEEQGDFPNWEKSIYAQQ